MTTATSDVRGTGNVFCAATHAQLHDSRLDRTLCHAHGSGFPSIACDVAYNRGLGGTNGLLGVEVSSPRLRKVRIVTQLRSRLRAYTCLTSLLLVTIVGHKQAEPGPSYDHMNGL